MRRYTGVLIALGYMFFINSVKAQQQTFGGIRTDFLVEGRSCFVVEPINPAANGRKPWVWYAPTIGNYPNHSNVWMFERLVQKGFWICGMDVGESYGNPEGSRLFSMFYDTLMVRFHLDPRACLVPQSRGGLMLYNWATKPCNSGKVSRIAGIYPICNITSRWLSKISDAYGMTSDAFQLHMKEYNPVDRLTPLVEAGVKIFHIHGDNDAVVPLHENSQVLYDRYKALGGNITLKVVPGKGHEEIPEYFESQEMLNFLLDELLQY